MRVEAAQWQRLRALAQQASESAYAPYSGCRVGAAVVDGAGSFHAGCNVENGSLGLTSCAERNALAAAVLAGARDLRGLLIHTRGERAWSPCGACRQVMFELMRADAEVVSCCETGADRRWSVSELLPEAFALQRPQHPQHR